MWVNCGHGNHENHYLLTVIYLNCTISQVSCFYVVYSYRYFSSTTGMEFKNCMIFVVYIHRNDLEWPIHCSALSKSYMKNYLSNLWWSSNGLLRLLVFTVRRKKRDWKCWKRTWGSTCLGRWCGDVLWSWPPFLGHSTLLAYNLPSMPHSCAPIFNL